MNHTYKKFVFLCFVVLLLGCNTDIKVCPTNTGMIRVFFDMGAFPFEAKNYEADCLPHSWTERMPNLNEFTKDNSDLDKPYLTITATYFCNDGCIITNTFNAGNKNLSLFSGDVYYKDIRLEPAKGFLVDNLVFRTECGAPGYNRYCPSCESTTINYYVKYRLSNYDIDFLEVDPMLVPSGYDGAYYITLYPLKDAVECCNDHALTNPHNQ
jgi:hypothetical protein